MEKKTCFLKMIAIHSSSRSTFWGKEKQKALNHRHVQGPYVKLHQDIELPILNNIFLNHVFLVPHIILRHMPCYRTYYDEDTSAGTQNKGLLCDAPPISLEHHPPRDWTGSHSNTLFCHLAWGTESGIKWLI